MLNGIQVIDADLHVNDWHIDWASHLPQELQPFAPRSVRDEKDFPRLEVDGRQTNLLDSSNPMFFASRIAAQMSESG